MRPAIAAKNRIAIACALIAVMTATPVAAQRQMRHVAYDSDHAEHSTPTASAFVPTDTWVYALLNRLATWGYIDTAFLGLRPWTRAECARLVEEAEENVDQQDGPAEVKKLLAALHAEFRNELEGTSIGKYAVHVDSVYARTLAIGGQPLNDSYHFGQTVINDFGRPYAAGFNQVLGLSGRADTGPFTFYLRGEYQHVPGTAGLSQAVRETIAAADGVPVQPERTIPATNQFRLLDTYVAAAVGGMQFAFGKQSLWWGPGEGDAMILSTNAEPFYMLRLTRTSPVQLPWIFAYLGPMRFDSFLGRLAGHHFPPRPFSYGQKISFKPTPNLEFGFSRTAVFAGEGVTPLTFSTFFHSFFSTSSGTTPGFDLRRNPGARHSSFDFSYRLPFLRRWVTLYSDSVVHDDVSPVSAPRRAAINPGVYLAHLPKLPKFDLRVEAINTDPPTARSVGGKFIYWEGIYRDAYTNKGNLLGSWIGREGKGGQAWLSYWLGPASRVQIGYRRAKLAKDFIPGGGTQNDIFATSTMRVRPSLDVAALVQYERWTVPVLASGAPSNLSVSLQLTWFPHLISRLR